MQWCSSHLASQFETLSLKVMRRPLFDNSCKINFGSSFVSLSLITFCKIQNCIVVHVVNYTCTIGKSNFVFTRNIFQWFHFPLRLFNNPHSCFVVIVYLNFVMNIALSSANQGTWVPMHIAGTSEGQKFCHASVPFESSQTYQYQLDEPL